MVCQHGFRAGEHQAKGVSVQVVLQYLTDQHTYDIKIMGTDTLLVSSAQVFCLLRVVWGHWATGPCHFCPQSMVRTRRCPWVGGCHAASSAQSQGRQTGLALSS